MDIPYELVIQILYKYREQISIEMCFIDENGYSRLACECWAGQSFNLNILFSKKSVWSYNQRAVHLVIIYVYVLAIINIMELCMTG